MKRKNCILLFAYLYLVFNFNFYKVPRTLKVRLTPPYTIYGVLALVFVTLSLSNETLLQADLPLANGRFNGGQVCKLDLTAIFARLVKIYNQ